MMIITSPADWLNEGSSLREVEYDLAWTNGLYSPLGHYRAGRFRGVAYEHNDEETVGPCKGKSDWPHYSPGNTLDLSSHGRTECDEPQPEIWVNVSLWKWTPNGSTLLGTDTRSNAGHPNWTRVEGNARDFCVDGNYYTYSNHRVTDNDGEVFTDATTSQPLPTAVECS